MKQGFRTVVFLRYFSTKTDRKTVKTTSKIRQNWNFCCIFTNFGRIAKYFTTFFNPERKMKLQNTEKTRKNGDFVVPHPVKTEKSPKSRYFYGEIWRNWRNPNRTFVSRTRPRKTDLHWMQNLTNLAARGMSICGLDGSLGQPEPILGPEAASEPILTASEIPWNP